MRLAIHAGMLKERVLFEQEVRIADTLGGFQSTWQTFKTHWAYVTFINGSALFESDALTSKTTNQLIIRRDDTLNIAMRCVFNAAIYRIEWITPYAMDARFSECRISTKGEVL